MTITRKFLANLSIEDDAADRIIAEYNASMAEVKDERDKAADEAKGIEALKQQLSDTKKELAKALAEADSGDGYKEKYEKLKAEFDEYKAEAEKASTHEEKSKAYRKLLTEIGIPEKRLDLILKYSDVDSIELENGTIKDAEKITESVKSDWGDLITTIEPKGADVPNPPANGGGGISKKEIMGIKDPSERQKAIAENIELFR